MYTTVQAQLHEILVSTSLAWTLRDSVNVRGNKGSRSHGRGCRLTSVIRFHQARGDLPYCVYLLIVLDTTLLKTTPGAQDPMNKDNSEPCR